MTDLATTPARRAFARRAPRFVVGSALVQLVGIGITVPYALHLRAAGREDLATLPEVVVMVLMWGTTAVVGASLVLRRPGHPVGWAFSLLATCIAVSGLIDAYSIRAVVEAPGSLPGGRIIGTIGGLTFVPLLVLVAVVLQLTPTGLPLSRRWGRSLDATVVAGVVMVLCALGSDRTSKPPMPPYPNPLALGPLAGALRIVAATAVTIVGIGVVTAALSLVVRFRRARGTERLQLLWFAVVAMPVAILMVASFVPGRTDLDYSPLFPTGALIVLIGAAAWTSVERYRLYDVERILSRTLSYSSLTVVLVVLFVTVTVVLGSLLGPDGQATRISVALGMLTTTALAEPARRVLQDRVDRRFDRRRHSALAVIRRAAGADSPIVDVRAVLREALADPTLRIAYPVEDSGGTRRWVEADGRDAGPSDDAVEVLRGSRVVARIVHDAALSPSVVRSALREAATELDNAGLRAALAVRVREVETSRTRLVTVQHEERRRIERDLHDGAQQRLLALAMNLQAAAVNGDSTTLQQAVHDGVVEARAAVAELRDLANGLRPAALADGGLAGALDDLADRHDARLEIRADLRDVPPAIEEVAWFIACEAVANAVRHAGADTIGIVVCEEAGHLALEVADDGAGGADPDGTGLRGLRDRAESVGGTFSVQTSDLGTTVVARLPCAS